MARIRLTRTLVDNVQIPEKGQSFVWDSDLPVGVRITPTGINAWIAQTRVRLGNERRISIGLPVSGVYACIDRTKSPRSSSKNFAVIFFPPPSV